MSPARFGSRYEVTTLLGKGGMGEVYSAHDKRLRRDVALKVLPEALAREPERVALFQREAQVIAALSHPNIAAIHELEELDGLRWLVLELVTGETLEERLSRGPLRIGVALSIARQICDALEAAHEKGIIHRDLKPSNIKITADEKVKLLDFGLASAFEVNPRTTDLGGSPTLPASDSVPTHAGTAAYMSPEQFQWKTINKQVDVWAFGCVLFEMLTGKRPFPANTLRETATLVLETEPNWSLLKHVPPRVFNLVQRCLEKDRQSRLHDIADARIEIDHVLDDKTDLRRPEGPVSAKKSKTQWLLAGVLVVGGAVLASAWWRDKGSPAGDRAVRFTIPVSQTNSITQISISPNGRKIAYVAGNDQGIRIIWIRDVDSASAKPLPEAQDPGGLFWAPDNEHLAFFNKELLKTVNVRDGNVRTITEGPGSTSGSWSESGEILIDSPDGDGLFRVSVNGGIRTRVTSPDRSTREQHLQPQFLPDGRQFLFLVKTNQPSTTGIYLGSLDSAQRRFLTNASGKAIFSAPSDLFFVRDGTLYSQRFLMDPPQVTGEAVRIAQHVSASAISGSAAFGASNGVLAYRSGSVFQNSELQWFDRQGNKLGSTAEPAPYTQVLLSPDEKYIAIERRDPDLGSYDIWLADPIKNTNMRLTFEDSSERHPVWFPDSQHLLFSSDKSGWSLLRLGIDSTADAEVVLKSDVPYRPMDITSNDTLLLRDLGQSFFTLGSGGARKPEIFLQSPYTKSGGRLSPNGKWLVFNSTDSGRDEIYIVTFPKSGRRQQISTNGGVQPMWSSSGNEIFYLDLQGRIMAVPFDENQTITTGIPKLLFDMGIAPIAGLNQYTVNGRGTRFLAIRPAASQRNADPIDVIVNWSEIRR